VGSEMCIRDSNIEYKHCLKDCKVVTDLLVNSGTTFGVNGTEAQRLSQEIEVRPLITFEFDKKFIWRTFLRSTNLR